VDKVLLRPAEAARALSVSRSKAYQMIKDGTLRSVRLGNRSVRVPVDAVRELASGSADRTAG
jgi:excisionase family DNA binding protein